MNIIYNIDLKDYSEMKKRDYLGFTSVELSNNLLFGKVAFIDNKRGNSIVFEAELLKFFIDFYHELIKAKKDMKKEKTIYSMYQSYMFEIKVEKKIVHLTFNKIKKLSYNYKTFIEELKRNSLKIYNDYKILYSNYQEIENGEFIKNHFNRVLQSKS